MQTRNSSGCLGAQPNTICAVENKTNDKTTLKANIMTLTDEQCLLQTPFQRLVYKTLFLLSTMNSDFSLFRNVF